MLKRVKFVSLFGPMVFTIRNAEDMESRSVEHL